MRKPDLCQRPYCRAPYTKVVKGYAYRPDFGRQWTLLLCDKHAKLYETVQIDNLGNPIHVQPRESLL
jgi:hypothetical protein